MSVSLLLSVYTPQMLSLHVLSLLSLLLLFIRSLSLSQNLLPSSLQKKIAIETQGNWS